MAVLPGTTHVLTDDHVTSCSYCTRPAKYMGDGQDGDFYCESHRGRAPGAVIDISKIN